MDGNTHDPTIIHTDVNKVTNLAATSIDQASELIKLLPTPLQIDEGSKLFKSLEEIRRVSSSINKANVGIQVDFINQDTTIGDANTSDDYEIINITSDSHFDYEKPTEIEMAAPKQGDDKIIETKRLQLDAIVSKLQENEGKLQDEHAISFIESEEEKYDDNDGETMSLKSNNSMLQHEDYSEVNEDTTLVNTSLNDTLSVSSVAISNDHESAEDINETDLSGIKSDTNKIIEETIKQEKSNMQQSPEITYEEKTPTITSEPNSSKKNSILNLVKPKDYKPKPREKVTVFGNWEDVKKLLNIAAKCMADQNYVKAKRMAEKSERIFPTPAAKALLEQIRIVTEAREAAERVKEKALEKAAKTTPENAEREAAKKTKERVLKEAAQKAIYEEKAAAEKAEREAAAEKAEREAAAEKSEREAAKKAKDRALIKAAQKAIADKSAAEKAVREAARNVSKVYKDATSKTSIEKGQVVLIYDQNAKVSGAESLNPGQHSESPDLYKARRAEGMMAVAQFAYSQGDISKAEKLAQKAQKLNPCVETDRLLDNIRNKLSEN